MKPGNQIKNKNKEKRKNEREKKSLELDWYTHFRRVIVRNELKTSLARLNTNRSTSSNDNPDPAGFFF